MRRSTVKSGRASGFVGASGDDRRGRMIYRLSFGIFALITATALQAQQTPPRVDARVPVHRAGAVAGHVVSDGRGVVAVSLELRRLDLAGSADGLNTQTDTLGYFDIDAVPAGIYKLSARKIGYRAEAIAVSVEDGVRIEQTIELARSVQVLDTVLSRTAAIKPEPYRTTRRFDEFFQSKARGVGHFYTREQLDSLGSTTFAGTVARIPGVRVAVQADGVHVHFARCQGALMIADAAGTMGRTGADDLLALIIDGTRVSQDVVGSTLASLRLSDIEAIEVYGGPAELPLEVMGNACGAIYVWTRFGVDRARRSAVPP